MKIKKGQIEVIIKTKPDYNGNQELSVSWIDEKPIIGNRTRNKIIFGNLENLKKLWIRCGNMIINSGEIYENVEKYD